MPHPLIIPHPHINALVSHNLDGDKKVFQQCKHGQETHYYETDGLVADANNEGYINNQILTDVIDTLNHRNAHNEDDKTTSNINRIVNAISANRDAVTNIVSKRMVDPDGTTIILFNFDFDGYHVDFYSVVSSMGVTTINLVIKGTQEYLMNDDGDYVNIKESYRFDTDYGVEDPPIMPLSNVNNVSTRQNGTLVSNNGRSFQYQMEDANKVFQKQDNEHVCYIKNKNDIYTVYPPNHPDGFLGHHVLHAEKDTIYAKDKLNVKSTCEANYKHLGAYPELIECIRKNHSKLDKYDHGDELFKKLNDHILLKQEPIIDTEYYFYHTSNDDVRIYHLIGTLLYIQFKRCNGETVHIGYELCHSNHVIVTDCCANNDDADQCLKIVDIDHANAECRVGSIPDHIDTTLFGVKQPKLTKEQKKYLKDSEKQQKERAKRSMLWTDSPRLRLDGKPRLQTMYDQIVEYDTKSRGTVSVNYYDTYAKKFLRDEVITTFKDLPKAFSHNLTIPPNFNVDDNNSPYVAHPIINSKEDIKTLLDTIVDSAIVDGITKLELLIEPLSYTVAFQNNKTIQSLDELDTFVKWLYDTYATEEELEIRFIFMIDLEEKGESRTKKLMNSYKRYDQYGELSEVYLEENGMDSNLVSSCVYGVGLFNIEQSDITTLNNIMNTEAMSEMNLFRSNITLITDESYEELGLEKEYYMMNQLLASIRLLPSSQEDAIFANTRFTQEEIDYFYNGDEDKKDVIIPYATLSLYKYYYYITHEFKKFDTIYDLHEKEWLTFNNGVKRDTYRNEHYKVLNAVYENILKIENGVYNADVTNEIYIKNKITSLTIMIDYSLLALYKFDALDLKTLNERFIKAEHKYVDDKAAQLKKELDRQAKAEASANSALRKQRRKQMAEMSLRKRTPISPEEKKRRQKEKEEMFKDLEKERELQKEARQKKYQEENNLTDEQMKRYLDGGKYV